MKVEELLIYNGIDYNFYYDNRIVPFLTIGFDEYNKEVNKTEIKNVSVCLYEDEKRFNSILEGFIVKIREKKEVDISRKKASKDCIKLKGNTVEFSKLTKKKESESN